MTEEDDEKKNVKSKQKNQAHGKKNHRQQS